jgi:hypothetical protein
MGSGSFSTPHRTRPRSFSDLLAARQPCNITLTLRRHYIISSAHPPNAWPRYPRRLTPPPPLMSAQIRGLGGNVRSDPRPWWQCPLRSVALVAMSAQIRGLGGSRILLVRGSDPKENHAKVRCKGRSDHTPCARFHRTLYDRSIVGTGVGHLRSKGCRPWNGPGHSCPLRTRA